MELKPNIPDIPRRDLWKNTLADWERKNLDIAGRYIGEPLYEFGFIYGPMEYVPIDKRYSAMLSHRWAQRALAIVVGRVEADL